MGTTAWTQVSTLQNRGCERWRGRRVDTCVHAVRRHRSHKRFHDCRVTEVAHKPPGEKKPARRPVLHQKESDYLVVAAASAAASAAVEAAEAASEAAAEAVAAAAAASAAGVAAASVVAGAATSVVVVAVVSAAGASTAAGVAGASSFFEQAARATAIRETISRDFFMIFLLIQKWSTSCCYDE